MLALCLMLLVTYYALNYAGIIGLDLNTESYVLISLLTALIFATYIASSYLLTICVLATYHNIAIYS